MNYRVCDIVSKKHRTTHINSGNKYFERPVLINGVKVLAEDAGMEEPKVKLSGRRKRIKEMLGEYDGFLNGMVD